MVVNIRKKRELVSKVVLIKKASSNPILIAGSGEFPIEAKEGETIRDLIRSSDSLRDQGCSPSISDYI